MIDGYPRDTDSRLSALLRDITRELVQTPVDLPRSHVERDQALLDAETIARRLGLLPPAPGNGIMATVTTSIGTSSRDYSTIESWEADLDNGALYSSGDDAVGECYADSDFTLSSLLTINGGTTIGLASVTLTAADGEKHDGTAGSGVTINQTSLIGSFVPTVSMDRNDDCVISWLTITGQNYIAMRQNGAFNADANMVHNCLIHDTTGNVGASAMISNDGGGRAGEILNNIIYNVDCSNGNSRYGIEVKNVSLANYIYNNTVYNVASSGTNEGLRFTSDTSNVNCKNNLAADCTTDFAFSGTTNLDNDYNQSSDSTAVGTNSLTSKSAASQFVSIVGGTEDLHLKSGADAIDAGTDLGTTPSGVEVDINGRDRDSNGDTWDIGAHEFVGGGGGTPVAVFAHHRHMAVRARCIS